MGHRRHCFHTGELLRSSEASMCSCIICLLHNTELDLKVAEAEASRLEKENIELLELIQNSRKNAYIS